MWTFRVLQPGEPERNPHEAEFFHLNEPSEAVVREFIQNSLDARATRGGAVRVKFILGTVAKNTMHRFLGEEFHDHLLASELFPEEYRTSNPVSFLTIEDFGTTGLDGQTGESGERPEHRENFYNFWWCEGRSLKTGHDAGRWGVGKTTFHVASKLRAFWGLTVRSDDKRKLLLGKALLKTHRLKGRTYQYYGYYLQEGFTPIDSESVIKQFEQTFSVGRREEPGLSLVIPMPDSEIEISSITRSVILHYFYAIMRGSLQVEMSSPSETITLHSQNLTERATEEDWQGTPWEKVNVGAFLGFIKQSIENTRFFPLPDKCAERLEINEDSFDGNLEGLQRTFRDMELVAIKVPAAVKEKAGNETPTYFHVFLRRDPTLKAAQEYYIRSGITISGIQNLGNQAVRALLVAEDNAVTAFLGDAETPAHTDWNERTEGFRNKYENASRALRFVRKSVSMIVSLLDLPPSERQIDFLKDIFSVPWTEPQDGEEPDVKPKIPDINARPQVFRIDKSQNGLRISLAKENADLPMRASLLLAYDVRRGNPFKQYEPNDFDLSGGSIAIKSTGCNIMTATRNLVDFQITTSDFSLEVGGFDPKRDVMAEIKGDEG